MAQTYSNQSVPQDELDFSLDNVLFHNNEHLDFSMSSILSKKQVKNIPKANQNSIKQEEHQSHNKTKNTQGTTLSIQHRNSNIVTVKNSKNRPKEIVQAQTKPSNFRSDRKKKLLVRSQSDALIQANHIEFLTGKRQTKQVGFTKRKLVISKEESKQQYYFGTGITVAAQLNNNKSKGTFNCQSRLNSVKKIRNLKQKSTCSKGSQNLNGILKKSRLRQFSKSSQYSKRSRQSSNQTKQLENRHHTNNKVLKMRKVEQDYDIRRNSSCKRPRNIARSRSGFKAGEVVKSPKDLKNSPKDLKKSQETDIMSQYFGYQGSKNSLSLKSQLNNRNQVQKQSNNSNARNKRHQSSSSQAKVSNRSCRSITKKP